MSLALNSRKEKQDISGAKTTSQPCLFLYWRTHFVATSYLSRELLVQLGLLVNQAKKALQVFVGILVLMAEWEIEGQLGHPAVLETKETREKMDNM